MLQSLDPTATTTWLAVAIALLYLSMFASFGLWLARGPGVSKSTLAGWLVAVFFTPVGLPYYCYRRVRGDTPGPDRSDATRTDRLLATWAVASITAFLFGALFSPPDPFTQLWYMLGTLFVTVPGAYVFVYRDGYSRLRSSSGV